MNIVEALKLSKKIINRDNGNTIFFGDNLDKNFIFSYTDLTTENWQPIIEKKTVTKKFYQAIFMFRDKKYFILDYLFENPENAEKYAEENELKLIRFLVENPIEVEVEE